MHENFYLDKWYLDLITEEGEAMIFYVAKLKWHGFESHYTSWLNFDSVKGTSNNSRLTQVKFPVLKDNSLTWTDTRFGISGQWESLASPIRSRLFESDEGYLDWNCHQPASRVHLKIGERNIHANGYAEQLILTIPPWKLNLEKLQWGRYGLPGQNLVWIQWKADETNKWIWQNGAQINECEIADEAIGLPQTGEKLFLDRCVVLESEKKVMSLVARLISHFPGIDKSMTFKFLMANETKWLSRTKLEKDGEIINLGWAIHELVTF